MQEQVTTYHLETKAPEELRRKQAPRPGVEARVCGIPNGELSRFFYQAVGERYSWRDFAGLTAEEWEQHAAGMTMIVGYEQDTPIGYAELRDVDGDIEVLHFGLLPRFVGTGLGGWFLSEVIATAWTGDPGRVFLHTCTLDHPSALSNYLARGMKIHREETGPLAP